MNLIKSKKYLFISIIIIASLFLFNFDNDEYYSDLSKNYDLFTNVLKEVNVNYVEEVKLNDLVKNGINGMLKDLDPYTVFVEEDDKESIDVISSGRYTGFGISVNNINNYLYVTDIVKDMPAYKSGMLIGDILFSIDGDTVQYLNGSELRKYSKGEVGTEANIIVLRQNNSNLDTLNLIINRDYVKVQNVTQTLLLNDSIGYLELLRFNKDAKEEFKNSLLELKSKNVKNIIIDLRNNPGGLLDAAIGICENFLPIGSEIVSTKGKTKRSIVSYKSQNQPIISDIKLAILINQNSASASEIVAGAIQDYDRGILVGTKSFGKGLVQSIFNLPFNNTLKITTARYYTPSGRCTQKIDYNLKDKQSKSDLLKTDLLKTDTYKTKNGRIVKEFVGINPDVVIEEEKYSQIVKDIYNNNLVFLFVNTLSIHKTQNESMKYDFDNKKQWDTILINFRNYLVKQKFILKTSELELLKNLEKELKKNNYSENLTSELTIIEALINKEYFNNYEKNKLEIKRLLFDEIISRIDKNENYKVTQKLMDKYVIESINNFENKKYNSILNIH